MNHTLRAAQPIRVSKPRAFATALVVWTVALAVLILASLQVAAFRHAADGREVLARLRATWAARAGVERQIARLQQEADAASPMGTSSLIASMAIEGEGRVDRATYAVLRPDLAAVRGASPGPTDAQSKLDIHSLTFDDLMLLPDMSEDIADAILDYLDTDDDIRELGAEVETYTAMPISYRPRNGPIRNIRELELVAGVRPEWVRGEDWNLNGLLDPNENDGDASWPADNADGRLNAGWSAMLTAAGTTGGLSVTGQERIDLSTADPSDVAKALGVEDNQAEAIVTYAQGADAKIDDFIRTDLPTLAQQGGGGGSGGGTGGGGTGGNQGRNRLRALTTDQLGILLDECVIGDPVAVARGKLNLNTADTTTLELINALDPTLRDAVILFRDQSGGDIGSLAELLSIPQMTTATLATLYPYIEVRSNVFHLVSRGRDSTTGITVEIDAEIDRSTQPVTIRRLVVR